MIPRCLLLVVCVAAANPLPPSLSQTAPTAWTNALSRMPLGPPAPLLNRDNAVCVLLDAFQSNDVIRALVVLPGVADDFYLVNRDQPKLDLRACELWSALMALTNATNLRITFRPPLLLLHTRDDRLQERLHFSPGTDAAAFAERRHLPEIRACDQTWDQVQPTLARAFAREILPAPETGETRHFERLNLRGWGLTDKELLQSLALTTKTTVEVQPTRLSFRLLSAPRPRPGRRAKAALQNPIEAAKPAARRQ